MSVVAAADVAAHWCDADVDDAGDGDDLGVDSDADLSADDAVGSVLDLCT